MDSGLGIGGHSTSYRSMTSSKLDLFQSIVYENGVTKGVDIEYYPISPPSDNGPVEFYIPPDPEKYIDIENTKLCGVVRMKKKGDDGNWSYTELTDKPYFINNYFHSLWSNVIIKVNDTEIGDSGTNSYAYGAYIQTLLAARERCRETILWSRSFIKDTYKQMDTMDETKNKGLAWRKGGGSYRVTKVSP